MRTNRLFGLNLAQTVSIYFPENLLDWLDEEARKNERSRSKLVTIILKDVKEGKLVPIHETLAEIETRKTKLPPSART